MQATVVKIGVILSSEKIKAESACQSIRQEYIDALSSANAELIFIQASKNTDLLDTHFSKIQGLLLAGGSDINPSLYANPPHPRLGQTDDLRDFSENYLFCEAYQNKKPILGICRGMQMINVSLGGNLFQDLPSQFQSEVNHQAEGPDRFSKKMHKIVMDQDSNLRRIIKRQSINVNSVHHQAIDRLGEELKISARSEKDGLIEGIESCREQFLLGVQCHPESLAIKIQPSWRRLFEAFIKACRL